jgi:CRISPR-associated endonuclease Cas1
VYALIYQYLRGLLQGFAFDPFIGFYHQPHSRRYSLALDLVEPFRPVCDRFVMALLNQRRLDEKDFESRNGGVYLNEQGRRKVLKIFYGFLEREGNWINFSDKQSLCKAARITIENFRSAVLHKSALKYPILSE